MAWLFEGESRSEIDALESARGIAVETPDAVAFLQDLAVEGRRAVLFAIAAVGAKPGWKPLEDAEMSDQAEQAAQGAQVLAPISPLVAFEKKNGREQDEREKGKRIKGLPEREQIALEKAVGAGEIVSVVSQQIIKARPSLTEYVSYQGVEEECQEAYKKRNGVQKTGQVHPEKGREEKRREQIIFESALEPR